MIRLRSHTKCPPGQFFIRIIYKDGRESFHFGSCKNVSNCKLFGASPLIDDVAKALSNFRSANNLPRATITESLEDVDIYTCQRIGGVNAWCVETERPSAAILAATPARGCATCGHKLK